jgi:hypothetical protein
MDGRKCSMCKDGILRLTEAVGRLDQCGQSYLPTSVFACDGTGCNAVVMPAYKTDPKGTPGWVEYPIPAFKVRGS